jgi:A nuclease family of the HNH/ENDO VII superfamily with conserved AHH
MAGPAAQSSLFQQHHLIPVAVGRRPQIGRFLTGLHIAGFHIEDTSSNLIALPADEATAARCGAALHRGPHPRYTAVVAARVERIRALHYRYHRSADDSVARLHRLQRALAAVLAGRAPRLITLNRHDPMRLFADYSTLDAAIDAMLSARS